jgi:3'-5' exoribonuclease
MKDFFIKQAPDRVGDTVTTFFLVHQKEKKSKRNGEPYLALVLGDRTGQIEGKVWDLTEGVRSPFEREDFVKVRGTIVKYNGRYEIGIERIRYAGADEVDLENYLPHTERNIDEMWAALQEYVDSIRSEAFRALLRSILDDEELATGLKTAPAAKLMHHAYIGGLLEHILSLCGLAHSIWEHYSWLNRDLLVAAAVLHDIGKVKELKYSRAIAYTDIGELVGHIALGLEILNDKAKLVPELKRQDLILLQHLILSHHGAKELGSPVEPRFAEALIFHQLDNMDSKAYAAQAALVAADQTGGWTARVPSLGHALLSINHWQGLAA